MTGSMSDGGTAATFLLRRVLRGVRGLLATGVLTFGLVPGVQAACDCADLDGDGYPEVDQSCQGSAVQQVSPYPGEGPAQPPAVISITFDRELTCGQYINGDYWVVEPTAGAGVTISATEPVFAASADDAFGARWKHGFQVDPVRVDDGQETIPQGQSFDQRVQSWVADGREGRASTTDPLPTTVNAGSSFVKAHSKPVWGGEPKTLDGTNGCQAIKEVGGSTQSCIRAFMVLTILAAAPANPSDTFRPPYVGRWNRASGARDPGWSKPGTGGAPGYRFADVRWSAFPRLDLQPVTEQSGYIANVASIRDSFRLPQVEILAHNQQRRLKAFDSSSGGPLYGDGGDYAPRWANVTSRAWLRLTGSDVFPNPSEERFDPVHRQALVNLLQFGIDQLHLTIDGDKMYVADGGHYAGGYLPALMACHLFSSEAPVGHDVSPQCEWLERNKAEGETIDVGYPMWGELTYVYRTPQPLDQQALCAGLLARTGYSCAELGIDPTASKVLYGQQFAQRPFNDEEKTLGGQRSCLQNWDRSVSTHCRDPLQLIDHPGNACRPDPDQDPSNYERIIQPNIRHVALVARLYGIFRPDGAGPFPNHLWDFAARRYWLGYETLPDAGPSGSENLVGYSGGANRCPDLHHQHACSEGKACYPEADEFAPVCWFCRGMMDRFPTYIHFVPGAAGSELNPPVFISP